MQERPGQESVPSSLIVCTSPYPLGQAISATKVCMPLLQLEQKGGLSVQPPEADGVSSLAALLLMPADPPPSSILCRNSGHEGT